MEPKKNYVSIGASSPAVKTILLVEDDVLIRISIADDLIDAGHKVIQSSHADDALRILESVPVDLVITDINMPQGSIDGFALADKIRKTWSSVKVIILSSHVTLDSHYDSAHLCLPKPIGMIKIVEYVQSILSADASNKSS